MRGLDAAIDQLRDLERDFERARSESLNEAQTRLHIIDHVIFDICGWPRREPTVATVEERVSDDGELQWIDYWLRGRDGGACVVVEAKRAGEAFAVEGAKYGPRKLQNIAPKPAKTALLQALDYGLKRGAELIAATNGDAWLFMRPFVSGIPRDNLRVIVFPSLRDAREHISEFLRLISIDAVTQREYIDVFERINRDQTPFARRFTDQCNERGVQEHDFAGGVRQLMRDLFGDITLNAEMLQYCYVEDSGSRVQGTTLDATLKARIPVYISNDGGTSVIDGDFEPALIAAPSHSGSLLLLVGNVGAGKSTFLARRLNEMAGTLAIEKNENDTSTPKRAPQIVVARVDFNTITASAGLSFSVEELTQTVSKRLLEEASLHAQKTDLWQSDPFDARNLRGICSDEIRRSKQKFVAAYSREPEMAEFEPLVLNVIDRVTRDTRSYLEGYAKHLKGTVGIPFIAVLDNVDQRNETLEKFIYTFGVSLSAAPNCVCIVALREDTYYRQRVGGFLSTRNDQPFFINAPRLVQVVSKRLKYGRDRILADPARLAKISRATPFAPHQIVDFVEILSDVFLKANEHSLELIEALSHRSVREAFRILEEAFLSGHFDVSRVILQYNQKKLNALYPLLLKALLLRNNRNYHAEQSRIKNLFSTSPAVRENHFTKLRLLHRARHARSSENRLRFRREWLQEELTHCGFAVQEVSDSFGQLVDWRAFVPSRAPAEARMAPEDEYEISAWGVYLISLSTEKQYLMWVAEDTFFYSRSKFDEYLSARRANRQALRVFLDYLSEEERRDLDNRPKLRSAPWLDVFSDRIKSIGLDIVKRS